MEKEFIYVIGEALMMDVDEVAEVTYPKNEMYPNVLYLETVDGRKFELTLQEKK